MNEAQGWTVLGLLATTILGLFAEARSGRRELRSDIADVRKDMTVLRSEVRSDIAELRAEVHGDIAELRSDISEIKVLVGRLDERLRGMEVR